MKDQDGPKGWEKQSGRAAALSLCRAQDRAGPPVPGAVLGSRTCPETRGQEGVGPDSSLCGDKPEKLTGKQQPNSSRTEGLPAGRTFCFKTGTVLVTLGGCMVSSILKGPLGVQEKTRFSAAGVGAAE